MYKLIPNVQELQSNLKRFAETIKADEVSILSFYLYIVFSTAVLVLITNNK